MPAFFVLLRRTETSELNVKCEDISLIHLFVFTWALKKVQGKNLDDLELCQKPLFIQFHVNNMFCLNTDATPSNRLQIRLEGFAAFLELILNFYVI